MRTRASILKALFKEERVNLARIADILFFKLKEAYVNVIVTFIKMQIFSLTINISISSAIDLDAVQKLTFRAKTLSNASHVYKYFYPCKI